MEEVLELEEVLVDVEVELVDIELVDDVVGDVVVVFVGHGPHFP